MQIKKVGVLGCGLMGSGIAQVSAVAGYEVTVLEQEQKFLDKGFAGIEKSLAKFRREGHAEGAGRKVRARLKGVTTPQALADCDIIVEAIIENVEEKKKMFSGLDAIVKKDAIFASNTSSISITEVAAATKRPDRFVGLHFFNPVPLMKLVEVARTIATSDAAFEAAYEFGKSLGKVPVRTSDKTGFIVNRLLVPYLLDAIRAYEEGVGSIPDIDNAMKLGCGYPMGPFTLLDFVGLDTTYYITQVMFDEFRERRFASPPLLKRLVMAGWYGRKSGKGFYDYADPNNPIPAKILVREISRESTQKTLNQNLTGLVWIRVDSRVFAAKQLVDNSWKTSNSKRKTNRLRHHRPPQSPQRAEHGHHAGAVAGIQRTERR